MQIPKQWLAVITDEKKRLRAQFLCVFVLLGIVAAFMTVLNIFTHKGALTLVTGAFSLLCLLNFLIVRFDGGREPGMKLASLLFMLELAAMFTFFVVSGNPDGFSAIWIAMLPGAGMLVFGRRRTAVFSALLFAMLVFFFWTAPGRSLLLYDYNPTFRARFPILFVASFSLSLLLETIRKVTQNELDRLRERYKQLSAHDYLTELLNRQGLEDWQKAVTPGPEQAVFMLDIDHFKRVNDGYGHDVGDMVLAAVARETERLADTQVCRWGGEEFVVWFPDSRKMTDPERIREAVERMVVPVPNCDKTVRVTISIGAVRGSGELHALIRSADEALYRAKQSGRNRVVWH